MLNKILLLIKALECSEINVKLMSKEWGNTDFLNEEYTKQEFHMHASSFTLSGFSSGAFLTNNLMNMYNDHIDGAGVLSGDGPCAARELWNLCNDTSKY